MPELSRTASGNAVKHFFTDFVRMALALPVVCHPITGYDTGKASATQDKLLLPKGHPKCFTAFRFTV
jgi:hypothetical protein